MDRRSFLGSLTGGLLATGAGSIETDTRFVAVVLALSAVVVFLLCTGVLVFVSSRRRRRKLVKMLVTLVAGSVCGAFWILLIDTAVNPAIPDAMHEPAVLVIGVVTALVAASLLSMANRLSEMVRLSAMAMGFHSLALPIAALISIVAGGAHAVDLRAVALSIGGLLLGVCLVFVGDRRRRRRSRSRARFDLGQPYA
jgi:peptidoglycan/LPS O-acetylase OafA/YrhL